MRILIDFLHPAHVHVFRNFRSEMLQRGHEVFATARDKDLTLELLDAFDIPAEVISVQHRGRLGLGTELLSRSRRLLAIARRSRPDVLVGIMGPSIAPVGRLLRIPSVVFYDTENAGMTNRWVYPMAAAVCTPDCYRGRVRGNHITYPGYHELAYLHPDRFIPDPAVVEAAGLSVKDPYAIMRFVGWQASHDLGEEGLTVADKRAVVARLAEAGRVLISSEAPLPDDLETLASRVPAASIHHLIAFASMVVGESATMASEAAVLGVPAVYIADTGRGYTDEQQHRYGLVKQVPPHDRDAIRTAINSFLARDRHEFAAARRRLLSDKIDTTSWMVDFIERRGWR